MYVCMYVYMYMYMYVYLPIHAPVHLSIHPVKERAGNYKEFFEPITSELNNFFIFIPNNQIIMVIQTLLLLRGKYV